MDKKDAIKCLKSIQQWIPDWDDREDGLSYWDATNMAIKALSPPNEPLTQADLDVMDYDKVWIDYEDGTGEWALVCDGVIYSIDTLEGAGLDFGEYMQGEMLEPHGYKVYRHPPEGDGK